VLAQYERALSAGSPFRDILAAELGLRFDAIRTGRDLAGVTGGGHQTNFSTSSDTSKMFDWCGDALQMFDTCNASLIVSGIAAPTDAQVKTEMVYRLDPCKEITPNFLGLRA
jgi:hypothetical protein